MIWLAIAWKWRDAWVGWNSGRFWHECRRAGFSPIWGTAELQKTGLRIVRYSRWPKQITVTVKVPR